MHITFLEGNKDKLCNLDVRQTVKYNTCLSGKWPLTSPTLTLTVLPLVLTVSELFPL